MIIAVDFDGTCVTWEYPKVGRTLDLAVETLQDLAKNHKIILLTMRSGLPLEDAIDWFRRHDIELWSANCNPQQHKWTSSRKVYAHVYIDDAALGCPLTQSGVVGVRPYVNWVEVRQMLVERGALS